MAPKATLGAHRLPPAPDAPREDRLRRSREMLFHALTQRAMVAVVGSGCSIPLGYPSWKRLATELIDRTLEVLSSRRHGGEGNGRRDHLRRLRQRIDVPAPVDSQELMFAIGTCKKALGGDALEDSLFHRYFEDRFGRPEPAVPVSPNPHRALLRLPINRFVTTNYDCEIERALAIERNTAREELGIGAGAARSPGTKSRLSFTQRPENCDQLALFALARVADANNMVFHCHGRFDDPGSIVATELDYQRWYLAEEGEAASGFLQTFDLLFNSNPILFVGFGVRDEDLMRPLRRIGASNPERRQFRPLFALLPEASDGEDWDSHERLFERYGLNVIPFLAPDTSEPEAWGRVLVDELARLEEERQRWQDEWLEKPMLRKVMVKARPPEPYRHYSVDSRGHETLGPQRVAAKLEELKEEALGRARVIGLIGPGGTGKSWHAMRLLEVMQRETSAFEGFFFWSSYYADDKLTFLDRLLEYIDPQGSRPATRLIQLRECLARSRHLIVLDGLERLLRTTDDPEVGASYDPFTRRLLEIIAEPTSQSTVVLTSRLWPQDLDENPPWITKHTLKRMRTEDIRGIEPFDGFDRAQVSALCSLLEGHAYALFLAGRFIRQGPRGEAADNLLTLHRVLSGAPPDRRLSSMIELAVEALDQETDNLARALLERLAVFMSPVTEETVGLCFALAAAGKGSRGSTPSARQVVDELLASGLLFRVASGPTERDVPAFSVHPTVRSYIFHQASEVGQDVLPNFTLAGFTSSRAAVHPGSPAAAKLVGELFDRLHDEAVREASEGRSDVARQFCRSMFGVMRSRMETNTVPRWTTYPEYIRFGLRLADLAKQLSPALWSFREPHELAEIERPGGPLYADELAFVYNDVGLTLCAKGYMPDTLSVWEQGYEINRIIEGTAELPLYSLQSQLHLGHTFIELGNLPIADYYLQETAQTNHKVKDRDYAGRILGYQALVSHYRGHLEEADAMYEKALEDLKEGGGNPRAQSFFLSHRAKLAMALGHLDKAEEYIRSSRAQAEGIRADDLVAYARTAQGRLFREQGAFVEANREFHTALAEARRLGIRRLEAEILTGLARLALKLGDSALARSRAMAALGIANEMGLGLRQMQSLLVLGMATAKAGPRRLGVAYLRLAKRLGDEQGYWLRSREAEQCLHELGEE